MVHTEGANICSCLMEGAPQGRGIVFRFKFFQIFQTFSNLDNGLVTSAAKCMGVGWRYYVQVPTYSLPSSTIIKIFQFMIVKSSDLQIFLNFIFFIPSSNPTFGLMTQVPLFWSYCISSIIFYTIVTREVLK